MDNDLMRAETTQQRAFVEAYEARTSFETPEQLARSLDVSFETLRRWMREIEFTALLDSADHARQLRAREVFARHLEAVVENVCDVAKGRTKAAMRAAEIVLKCVGVIQPSSTTQITNIQATAHLVNEETDDVLIARLREMRRIVDENGLLEIDVDQSPEE